MEEHEERDGQLYIGAKEQRMKVGPGVLITPNRSLYKGQFSDNVAAGLGVLKIHKRSYYKGEFKNNQYHGTGVLISEKLLFKGQFIKGKKEGPSITISSLDQSVIEKCYYKENLIEGYGTYKLVNPMSSYQGYFSKGLFDSLGKEECDKYIYHGQYQLGERHGVGLCQHTKKIYYLGFWRSNLKHGFGEETTSTGDKFQGSYVNDLKTGTGRLTKEKDVVYLGMFKEDEFYGMGRLETPTEVYIGHWKKSMKNGLGYYLDKSKGESYFGDWSMNQRNGIGTSSCPEGKYKGYWSNNKRHGLGFFQPSTGGPGVLGEYTNSVFVKNSTENKEEYMKKFSIHDFDKFTQEFKARQEEDDTFVTQMRAKMFSNFKNLRLGFEEEQERIDAQIDKIQKYLLLLDEDYGVLEKKFERYSRELGFDPFKISIDYNNFDELTKYGKRVLLQTQEDEEFPDNRPIQPRREIFEFEPIANENKDQTKKSSPNVPVLKINSTQEEVQKDSISKKAVTLPIPEARRKRKSDHVGDSRDVSPGKTFVITKTQENEALKISYTSETEKVGFNPVQTHVIKERETRPAELDKNNPLINLRSAGENGALPSILVDNLDNSTNQEKNYTSHVVDKGNLQNSQLEKHVFREQKPAKNEISRQITETRPEDQEGKGEYTNTEKDTNADQIGRSKEPVTRSKSKKRDSTANREKVLALNKKERMELEASRSREKSVSKKEAELNKLMRKAERSKEIMSQQEEDIKEELEKYKLSMKDANEARERYKEKARQLDKALILNQEKQKEMEELRARIPKPPRTATVGTQIIPIAAKSEVMTQMTIQSEKEEPPVLELVSIRMAQYIGKEPSLPSRRQTSRSMAEHVPISQRFDLGTNTSQVLSKGGPDYEAQLQESEARLVETEGVLEATEEKLGKTLLELGKLREEIDVLNNKNLVLEGEAKKQQELMRQSAGKDIEGIRKIHEAEMQKLKEEKAAEEKRSEEIEEANKNLKVEIEKLKIEIEAAKEAKVKEEEMRGDEETPEQTIERLQREKSHLNDEIEVKDKRLMEMELLMNNKLIDAKDENEKLNSQVSKLKVHSTEYLKLRKSLAYTMKGMMNNDPTGEKKAKMVSEFKTKAEKPMTLQKPSKKAVWGLEQAFVGRSTITFGESVQKFQLQVNNELKIIKEYSVGKFALVSQTRLGEYVCIEKGSSNLHFFSSEFEPIHKENSATPTQSVGKDGADYSHFKFTGDKNRMLWNKGKGILSIIDTKKHMFQNIENFWNYSTKNRLLEPLICICDKNAQMIYGVGRDKVSNSFHNVFFKVDEPAKKEWANNKLFPAQIEQPLSADISLCQKFIYVGGFKTGIAVICALSFSEGLEIKSTKKFISNNVDSISKIKRVEGTEILLLGGLGCVVVGMYNDERTQFDTFQIIEGLSESLIEQMIFQRSFIIVLNQEKDVTVGVKLHLPSFPDDAEDIEYNNSGDSEEDAKDLGGNIQLEENENFEAPPNEVIDMISQIFKLNSIETDITSVFNLNTEFFTKILTDNVDDTGKKVTSKLTIDNIRLSAGDRGQSGSESSFAPVTTIEVLQQNRGRSRQAASVLFLIKWP